MNDAEKLVAYEILVKEKKRQTRIDNIGKLILGIVALTTMCVTYLYYADLAFKLEMKVPNAYIMASVILLVLLIFASSTIKAYERVFKQEAEK